MLLCNVQIYFLIPILSLNISYIPFQLARILYLHPLIILVYFYRLISEQKFRIMKKSLSLLIITSLVLTLFTGCKKDKGDPPLLPPAESMTIDFSNFESGAKSDFPIFESKGTQNSNWEFSAAAAILWKTIISTTLAVPVYSFKATVSKQPVYLDDNTWQWSAEATVLSATYKARLTGQITSANVVWKMYITKEGTGGYTDFLWFDGTSKPDGTEGQWILYESPQNSVEILKIDWSVSGNEIGMVKYSFTKAGNSFAGSYIEYGLTANELNAYYIIHYYSSAFETFFDLNVEWSTTLHNGRVKCEEYFGTTDWYCWDGNYLNVTCP